MERQKPSAINNKNLKVETNLKGERQKPKGREISRYGG